MLSLVFFHDALLCRAVDKAALRRDLRVPARNRLWKLGEVHIMWTSAVSSLGDDNLEVFARNDHRLVAGRIEASDEIDDVAS